MDGTESVVGRCNDTSQLISGGEIPLQSHHPLKPEPKKLILKMKAIGDPRDEISKQARVPRSPTRLVALFNYRVLYYGPSITGALHSLKLTTSDGIQIENARQSSELREKLLRDRIKKMRTSSIASTDA